MAIDWDSLVIGPNVAIFGEQVTYTSAGGGTIGITGVFNDGFFSGRSEMEGADWGNPGGVTTEQPVLGVQLSQFPIAPAQGDLALVRGTTYAVRQVQPDGNGGAVLLLNQFYG